MSSYWEWNKENFPGIMIPSSKHSDVTYVGRFINEKIEEHVQDAVSKFTPDDEYDEVSYKGESYNEEARIIMEG